MPYVKGLGEALAEGLASGVNQFVQTDNTMSQQRLAQQNTVLDQQYRQAQADESKRQFEVQQKSQRDRDAFKYITDTTTGLRDMLTKGGYQKGSPEYEAAVTALGQLSKYSPRVLRGETLAPEELGSLDEMVSNAYGIMGQGAGALGAVQSRRDESVNQGLEQDNTSKDLQNQKAAGTLQSDIEATNAGNNFSVATSAGRVQAENANNKRIADTAQGQTEATNATNQGIVDTQSSKTAATNAGNKADQAAAEYREQQNELMTGLIGLEKGEKTASYLFNQASKGVLPPEKVIASLVSSGQISQESADTLKTLATNVPRFSDASTKNAESNASLAETQARVAKETADKTITAMNTKADLSAKTDLAAQGLVSFATQSQRASYLKTIADSGAIGAAVVQEMLKNGDITKAEAAGATTTATNAQNLQNQTSQQASNTTRAQNQQYQQSEKMFPVTMGAARTAWETAVQQLEAFKENRPINLAAAKNNLAMVEFNLEHAKDMSPAQLALAWAQVGVARSQLRVAEATEGSTISNAQSSAAINQSAATVATATTDTQISSAETSLQQQKANVYATLQNNKYNDATFAARVQTALLTPKTGLQALLNLQQQYQQNAEKFPIELETLKSAIEVKRAQETLAKDPQYIKLGAAADKLVKFKTTVDNEIKNFESSHKDITGGFNAEQLSPEDKKRYDNLLVRQQRVGTEAESAINAFNNYTPQNRAPVQTDSKFSVPETPGRALPAFGFKGVQQAITPLSVSGMHGTPYGGLYFGGKRHNGEDYFGNPGDPVNSLFTGTATVRWSKTTGQVVEVTDATGKRAVYGHMQGNAKNPYEGLPPELAARLKAGGGKAVIQRGETLGYIGQTGSLAHTELGEKNAHVHFMVYDRSGKDIDPKTTRFVPVSDGAQQASTPSAATPSSPSRPTTTAATTVKLPQATSVTMTQRFRASQSDPKALKSVYLAFRNKLVGPGKPFASESDFQHHLVSNGILKKPG